MSMKGKKIGEDKYTEHWSLDGHSYVGVPKWVVKQVREELITEIMDIKIGSVGSEHWDSFSKNPRNAYVGGRQDAVFDYRNEIKRITNNKN